MFYSYILNLPAGRLIDSAIQTEDHIRFWETFRSYLVGGDKPGAELLSTSLWPVIDLIMFVAVLLITAQVLYTSAQKGQGLDGVLQRHLPKFLILALAFYFLGNNFVNSYQFVEDAWKMRQGIRQTVTASRTASYTLANAINNQLFYHKFGSRVEVEFAVCNSMTKPAVHLPSLERPPADADIQPTATQSQAYDYLECLETAQRNLNGFFKKAAQECTNYQGTTTECVEGAARAQNLVNVSNDRIGALKKFYLNDSLEFLHCIKGTTCDLSDVPDLDFGAFYVDGNEPFIKSVRVGNWYFLTYLELAWGLGGAFFPGVIAVSILPSQVKVIADWFVTALSLIVAENVYIYLIGVVALASQDSVLESFGSQVFLQFIGSVAPFAAGASFLFSGFMMARQYRGSGTALAIGTVSIVSGGVASILYGINSQKYLRK